MDEKPCNYVDVFKGPCVLPLGHPPPHQWENSDATGPAAPDWFTNGDALQARLERKRKQTKSLALEKR